MELVIDNSVLEDAELTNFLRKRSNIAVLTDVTAKETFSRGERAVQMHEILARHPGQVLVLRSIGELTALRPRSKGLYGRLINWQETSDFPQYAERLVRGPGPLRDRLQTKQEAARTYLDNDLLPHAESMRSELHQAVAAIPADDLRLLKREGRITKEIMKPLMPAIARWTGSSLTKAQLEAHRDNVLWSFQFRFAVCVGAMAIHWANKGGLAHRRPEKVRNDIADCAVSACGTFFDGILTDDGTQRDVHRLARQVLSTVFRLPLVVGSPYKAAGGNP